MNMCVGGGGGDGGRRFVFCCCREMSRRFIDRCGRVEPLQQQQKKKKKKKRKQVIAHVCFDACYRPIYTVIEAARERER